MNPLQAMAAVEQAQEIIDGCESIDELDKASDYDQRHANCPDDFTDEQRDLVHQILLKEHLKSIGRA